MARTKRGGRHHDKFRSRRRVPRNLHKGGTRFTRPKRKGQSKRLA